MFELVFVSGIIDMSTTQSYLFREYKTYKGRYCVLGVLDSLTLTHNHRLHHTEMFLPIQVETTPNVELTTPISLIHSVILSQKIKQVSHLSLKTGDYKLSLQGFGLDQCCLCSQCVILSLCHSFLHYQIHMSTGACSKPVCSKHRSSECKTLSFKDTF